MSRDCRAEGFRTYLSTRSISGIYVKSPGDEKVSKGVQGSITRVYNNNKQYVAIKTSNNTDFSLRNEIRVMKYLKNNNIRNYTPSMAYIYDKDKSNDKELHMEYIKYETTFSSFIRDIKFSDESSVKMLLSLIVQTLITIKIYNSKLHMVHNDLHTDNVMLGFCPRNITFKYVLDDIEYLIPTYGVYPIIVDYGNCFIGNVNTYLYTTMNNTNLGNYSCIDDNTIDARIFLCNVRDDILSKNVNNLPKEVNTLLTYITSKYSSSYNIKNGRLDSTDCSCEDIIKFSILKTRDKVKREYKDSVIFLRVKESTLIIQSLVKVPLVDYNLINIEEEIVTITEQLHALETYFLENESKLLLLTCIIDSIRKTSNYEEFNKEVTICIMDKIHSFYFPKGFTFYILYYSLIQLTKIISTIYYRELLGVVLCKTTPLDIINNIISFCKLKSVDDEVLTWNVKDMCR